MFTLIQFITFRFLDLEIELSDNCNYDHVELTNRIGRPVPLKRFCGNEIPPSVTVPARKDLRMYFFSDEIYEYKGFSIEYKVVYNDVKCPEGEFQCRTGQCVEEHRVCDTLDDCGDGTDEQQCNHLTEEPEICGLTPVIPELGNGDRIVGGRDAVAGSWPWQVSFQYIYTYPSGHFCGGAVVNRNWILTAAHCVKDKYKEEVRIHFGNHHRWMADSQEVIRYPTDWYFYKWEDIALVRFNAPLSFNDVIQPVCMPELEERVEDGTMGHVTGWGNTIGTGHSTVLKQAMVPIFNFEACSNYNTPFSISPTNICSGTDNGGINPCFGDSGGPLVAQKIISGLYMGWYRGALWFVVSSRSQPSTCECQHFVNGLIKPYLQTENKRINKEEISHTCNLFDLLLAVSASSDERKRIQQDDEDQHQFKILSGS
ncbi:trypsin-2-like [Tachypleus tridentatus]|uniref:trypsin-2-like n=1 Tax=Tachypleus tridentatus TaxID=6853 RepID=UPI003FD124CE